MFKFRGQTHPKAVLKMCFVFFLLPDSMARSQTDRSKSQGKKYDQRFGLLFETAYGQTLILIFPTSKSKSTRTHIEKNKENCIARKWEKAILLPLRSLHYHHKRLLNHYYNRDFCWSYADSPIARMEHLHGMIPQPFTYYTMEVKREFAQRKHLFTNSYAAITSTLQQCTFLFSFLRFCKRKMDGFCGLVWLVGLFVWVWEGLLVWF